MLKMKNETPEHFDLEVLNADGERELVAFGESVEVDDADVAARAAQGFTATAQSIGAAVKRAEKAAADKAEEQEADAEEAPAEAGTPAEGEQA